MTTTLDLIVDEETQWRRSVRVEAAQLEAREFAADAKGLRRRLDEVEQAESDARRLLEEYDAKLN